MDIETLGVAAVKMAIAKTDYLQDHIKDKEKEPMWDGAIYAYSSNNKVNSAWIGRAPVQVKGESVDSLNIKEMKYDINVDNLKNYKLDGGLLFFVVAVNRDGETSIFYKALTPYLINQLLKLKQEQKTISVKFGAFPKKANEIYNIVRDFIRDSKKQELFTHDKIPTLKEFLDSAGKDISYGFEFSGMGYNINEPYKYLFEHEIYMYAINTKLNINFPIEHIQTIEKAWHSMEMSVKIEEKEYYKHCNIVHRKDITEIHIGNSTVIELDSIEKKIKINYKLSGNIKQQIKDIQFIVDFIEKKKTSIGDVNLSIEQIANEMKLFDVEKALKHQANLIMVDNMLTDLGVKKALELTGISQKEEDYLNMLISSVVNKEEMRFDENNIPPVGEVSIGNISILLYFEKTENGGYIIKSFADADCDVAGEYLDGSTFQTSKYVLLKAEDIIKTDNFTCNQMVNELMTINNEGHYDKCNLVLLELLKAYDETKDAQYLNEALRLADWLKEDRYHKGLSTINYYQCIKRQKLLSKEQENEIMELIEIYNNDEIKAAAYILLENYKMANRIIDRFDPSVRNMFEQFPIYSLMNSL